MSDQDAEGSKQTPLLARASSKNRPRKKSMPRLFTQTLQRRNKKVMSGRDFVPDVAVIDHCISEHGKGFVNMRYDKNQTGLHIAINQNLPLIMECLVDRGANLDLQDDNGWAPLHITCQQNEIHATMYLIAAGANCILLTNNGNSPLHYFIASKEENSLYFVVLTELTNRAGPTISLQNATGNSCLHIAAKNNVKIMSLLLHQLTDEENEAVNAQNEFRDTPLHIATRNADLPMIKLLLAHKADPTLKNCFSRPSQFKEIEDNPEIKKILLTAEKKLKKKGKRSTTLYEAEIPTGLVLPKAKNDLLDLRLNLSPPPAENNENPSPQPSSARLSKNILLKGILLRSTSEKMNPHKNLKPRDQRRASAISSLEIDLESRETISEEIGLFEKVPTPRSRLGYRSVSENLNLAGLNRRKPGVIVTSNSSSFITPKRKKKPTSRLGHSTGSEGLSEGQFRSTSSESVGEAVVEPQFSPERIFNKTLSTSKFPLQKKVTIPMLREEEVEEPYVSDAMYITTLEQKLSKSEKMVQQLRIELEMTKELLQKAENQNKKEKKEKRRSLSNRLSGSLIFGDKFS